MTWVKVVLSPAVYDGKVCDHEGKRVEKVVWSGVRVERREGAGEDALLGGGRRGELWGRKEEP
jgi:hypothetical protein